MFSSQLPPPACSANSPNGANAPGSYDADAPLCAMNPELMLLEVFFLSLLLLFMETMATCKCAGSASYWTFTGLDPGLEAGPRTSNDSASLYGGLGGDADY